MEDKDEEDLFDSLSDDEDNNVDNDQINDVDTWIEELECALLADCDPATLKKISEGRRIPSSLRPDYWKTLLALNDAGKVKLTREYDLGNQLEIRQDCERLVDDIEKNLATTPLTESDKLRLLSDFESTLTTYVKARPELCYTANNGWTDILKILYHLELSDIQLYQMFFRIVDRYIPKDLSLESEAKGVKSSNELSSSTTDVKSLEQRSTNRNKDNKETTLGEQGDKTQKIHKANSSSQISDTTTRGIAEKSVQAYHLLRLLIQYHDPELCSILDSRKVTPNVYVKDWFCSLFSRSCSPKLALLIWDTHFRMADPFLIFFAAIVMVVNASDELKKKNMNQAEMLNVLKGMPAGLEEDDIEDLYYLVSNHYTNSTPRSIRSYSHLFFMDTFGNTYSGSDSPEDGRPLTDVRTCRLTSSLDLSQYLCLPIVPAEVLALDTAHLRHSPTHASALKYFLVDCRPAEQYNAGHLTKAFHLDCSLMLREPSSFSTAVQALLEIQRQVVASKSNAGGQHLCFIGSGQEEEDQYVNMVVASFLQKYQKYVSIVVGGFEAIHDYVKTKSELMDSFDQYIVDHNADLCKTCLSKIPGGLEQSRLKALKNSSTTSVSSSTSLAQSIFASTNSFLRGDKSSSLSRITSNPQATATANILAQSGVSMLDKFAAAFVSKSSVIKERLVDTLNTTNIPLSTVGTLNGAKGHVSSQDKLGKRYTGGNLRYAIDDDDANDLSTKRTLLSSSERASGEPIQEIQIETWQKEVNCLAFYKCAQIKGNVKCPGYIAVSKTHLWILREIPHNKGFASIAAKRPLNMVVQITSKRRQPDLIIFRYGYANQNQVPKNVQQEQPKSSDSPAPTQDSSDASTSPQQSQTSPDAASKNVPLIIATDQLHIPQAFEVIRLIKREIVRIMDETSRAASVASLSQKEPVSNTPETKESVAVVETVTDDSNKESAANSEELVKVQ